MKQQYYKFYLLVAMVAGFGNFLCAQYHSYTVEKDHTVKNPTVTYSTSSARPWPFSKSVVPVNKAIIGPVQDTSEKSSIDKLVSKIKAGSALTVHTVEAKELPFRPEAEKTPDDNFSRIKDPEEKTVYYYKGNELVKITTSTINYYFNDQQLIYIYEAYRAGSISLGYHNVSHAWYFNGHKEPIYSITTSGISYEMQPEHYLQRALSVLEPLMPVSGTYNAATSLFETKDTSAWVDFFDQGFARIVRSGYTGLIDTSGKIIVPALYDKVFPAEAGIIRITKDGKFGFYSIADKKFIKPFTNYLDKFSEGVAVFEHPRYLSSYCLITQNGDLRMAPNQSYTYLSPMKEGRAAFVKSNKVGLLSKEGKEIVTFDQFTFQEFEELINYHYRKLTIRYIEPGLFEFNENRAPVFSYANKELRYGYTDRSGKTVIPAGYEEVRAFKNGLAMAMKNKKWGVIDTTGATQIPFEYTLMEPGGPGQFIVSKGEKYGVISSGNQTLLRFNYPVLYHLTDDLYITYGNSKGAFNKLNKWGLINSKGKHILPFNNDAIVLSESGKIKASRYESGYSLNTGIPRYIYKGYYTVYEKDGSKSSGAYPFSKLIQAVGDGYYAEGVVKQKPDFFAPLTDKPEPEKKIVTDGISTTYDFVQELKGGFKIVGIEAEDKGIFNRPVPDQQPSYKKGLVDPAGKLIIPIVYEDIIYNGTPLLVVAIDTGSTTRFIQTAGEQRLVKPYISIDKKKKYGVVNLENKLIVPLVYDHIQLYSSAIAVSKNEETFKKEGINIFPEQWRVAVYDLLGNELLPFAKGQFREYDSGQWEQDGYLVDRKGTRMKR